MHVNSKTNIEYLIEEAEEGFYVFVYKVGNPISVADYLQDDLCMAKEFALEEFGIALDAWVEVSGSTRRT